MKKGLTEVIFILDRSGSMSGLEQDTIGGFNSMIDKQKQEEGEAVVSTILFDDQVEVLHDRIGIQNIEQMTNKEYYVRGCTALLDAVGSSIKHVSETHKNSDPEEIPEKTLFIITTDGMENSSHQYTYDKVKKMIEKKKSKKGWEFMFLGANIDAISEAARFGISKDRAVRYECDAAGTALNFSVLNKAISGVRCAKNSAEMNESFECMYEIAEDYKKRHKDN